MAKRDRLKRDSHYYAVLATAIAEGVGWFGGEYGASLMTIKEFCLL
jgi:hypothetical protein